MIVRIAVRASKRGEVGSLGAFVAGCAGGKVRPPTPPPWTVRIARSARRMMLSLDF